MFKIIFPFLTLFLSVNVLLMAETKIYKPLTIHSSSVAIITDAETFNRVEDAIFAYRDAIELDELSAYIVVNKWIQPDEVRREIIKLSKNELPLEGVVLVGDVPIAMIRNAQHLTSAFKIDQNSGRYPLIKTSVPSDRFYDDFDLQFSYLQKDTSNQLLHYYNLKAQSAQKIECDIYSGRIKAPVDDDSKYIRLEEYLIKVSKIKKQINKLEQAFVFSGHGYHSESLDSWSSSILNLHEQFSSLYLPGNRLKSYNHSMSPNLKYIIFNELENPENDLAMFHAHGSTDTQYLLGLTPTKAIAQNVEANKLFLRGKLRQAKRRDKSVEETKADYIKRYDIPESWFETAFVDSVIKKDSLLYANQDIYVTDIEKIKPQVPVILFDECFNGAFFKTPYIAGQYLFNKGGVVTGIANSVNVLQDIWSDEFIGLLSSGVRVGNWHKMNNYLESHILGDPTFHYTYPQTNELNQLLLQKNENEKKWQRLLTHKNIPIRATAVFKMFNIKGSEFEQELVDIYKNDSSQNVRMEALKCLATLGSENFLKLLHTSVNDPAEFIRRVTVSWMGDIGLNEYLPLLATSMISDPSKRVRFNAKSAIQKIGPEKALKICSKSISSLPSSEYQKELLKSVTHSFERTADWLNSELKLLIRDKSKPLKKRISAARRLRNYRFHQIIPDLINTALDKTDDLDLRIQVVETMGWFGLSFDNYDIVAVCNSIIDMTDSPEILKDMALMTKNRIVQGLNNPITP